VEELEHVIAKALLLASPYLVSPYLAAVERSWRAPWLSTLQNATPPATSGCLCVWTIL